MKACKGIALKFQMSIPSVQKQIAYFKAALGQEDESDGSKDATAKAEQLFEDSCLPPGSEWCMLKDLGDDLKADDYVKVRWSIFLDDARGQALLAYGLKGQVQAIDV